jgi:hypothetical protein
MPHTIEEVTSVWPTLISGYVQILSKKMVTDSESAGFMSIAIDSGAPTPSPSSSPIY